MVIFINFIIIHVYVSTCMEWFQNFEEESYLYFLLISSSKFNLPLIGTFHLTHAARALQSHDVSGEGIKLWTTYIVFLTTQGHGGPPRMSDQPNTGETSETAQT